MCGIARAAVIPVSRVSVWAGLCTTVACRKTTAAFEQNHPNDSLASKATFADDAPTLSTEGRQGTRLRRRGRGTPRHLTASFSLGQKSLGDDSVIGSGNLLAQLHGQDRTRAARAPDGRTTENRSSCAAWQRVNSCTASAREGMALGPYSVNLPRHLTFGSRHARLNWSNASCGAGSRAVWHVYRQACL